jgi:hypothetical protein
MRSFPPVIEQFDHDILHKIAHVSAKFRGQRVQDERDIFIFVLAAPETWQPC